jgi:serine protease Do
LKVNGSGFSFVTFADRQPRVGDWVLAMGNPFDLGGTVTAGIVSASGRDIGSGPYNDYLQIDAPVNKGNSGGPSFNLSGEVVGVNTAIYSTSGGSIGIAFDIPADTAKTVAHELETKGKVTRGWIGVTVQALTQDIADNLGLKKVKGALVDEVEDGGPAAKAGLKNGDIIFMLDGSPIADSRDLARKVAAQSPGTPLKVFTRRNGVERTVELTVGTLPNAQAPQSARETQRESGLGMSLAPADQVTGAGSRGVVVLDVDPGGAAAEKGVQQGDVIVGVGGKPVSTPQELSSDINEARKSGRHSVLLRLKSASGPHFVAVPIGQG